MSVCEAAIHFHGNPLTCVLCLVVPYKCCCCNQKWKQFSLCVSIVAQKKKIEFEQLLKSSLHFYPSSSSTFQDVSFTVLNTCTSTVSIFGYHNNLQFILLSVPESLCCVSRAGDALSAAGPLQTLKGSSVILEKFWTFFFFFFVQLCKRKYNQLAITHLNNPPTHLFLNLWSHFRWGPGRLPRVTLLCSLAVCLTSFSVKRRDFQE